MKSLMIIILTAVAAAAGLISVSVTNAADKKGALIYATATSTFEAASDRDGKFALLVGIDNYQHVHKLNGAVEDIEAIHSLLTSPRFGFDPKNVVMLKDPIGSATQQGTAENIIGEFIKLID